MKSVTQCFYDISFQEAQKLVGETNVYQFLPLNANTPYPFVVVNDTSTSTNKLSKHFVFKDIKVYMDIWGDENQRKQVDDIVNKLFNLLVPHGLNVNKSSYQITADTSTDEVFWRARVIGVFNNG